VEPRLIVVDEAVAAHGADEMEAVFALDALLHFTGPCEIRFARHQLLDSAAERLFTGFHQFRDLLGGLSEDVGPASVADPTAVGHADVDFEDVAGLHGTLDVTVPAVDDAVVEAKTRVAWKGGKFAAFWGVPEKATLGFLLGDLLTHEFVDLRQRLANLQKVSDATMTLDDDLRGSERGVGLGRVSNAILDRHGTGMIGGFMCDFALQLMEKRVGAAPESAVVTKCERANPKSR
jgi:hypothetical protein